MWQGGLSLVTNLSQARTKQVVTRLLHGCYKVVTCLWQGGLSLVTVSIPWLMQPCYNQCTRWPQTCCHLVTSQHEQVVTRLLQTCYKLVTGLTFLYGLSLIYLSVVNCHKISWQYVHSEWTYYSTNYVFGKKHKVWMSAIWEYVGLYSYSEKHNTTGIAKAIKSFGSSPYQC